jgi:methylthioribose-1-phosphate isomerase
MIDAVRWKCEDGTVLAGVPQPPERLGQKGALRLIDQTLLPEKLEYITVTDEEEIFDCIKRLVVRGAPAIGCAAALGLAAVMQRKECGDAGGFVAAAEKSAEFLNTSRPTAVNLEWALNKVVRHLKECASSGVCSISSLRKELLKSALEILEEDIELCRSIGRHGVELFKGRKNLSVLTHCNAGALATGDYGTALSPVYTAFEKGLEPVVYSDETRPLLQGARLTAWELNKAGVKVITICDGMAGQVMKEGKIDIVITGADRIAANGDSANKIGTYSLAVLAGYHNIPFYIAAPYSTVDCSLSSGDEIPIEQRAEEEIKNFFGRRTVPEEVEVYNPAFDVTPAELITGIITDRGILYPPFNLKKIIK